MPPLRRCQVCHDYFDAMLLFVFFISCLFTPLCAAASDYATLPAADAFAMPPLRLS